MEGIHGFGGLQLRGHRLEFSAGGASTTMGAAAFAAASAAGYRLQQGIRLNSKSQHSRTQREPTPALACKLALFWFRRGQTSVAALSSAGIPAEDSAATDVCPRRNQNNASLQASAGVGSRCVRLCCDLEFSLMPCCNLYPAALAAANAAAPIVVDAPPAENSSLCPRS